MIKTILNKILPPKEKAFFALFEANAQICCEAADILLETVNDQLTEENTLRAKDLKHASNKIMQQILTILHHSYITPIDREDIQLISTNLNNATKKISKSILLLNTYQLSEYTDYLKQQNLKPNEIRKKTESVRLFFKQNNMPLGFGVRAHLQFLFK